jgi:hypothetical protein
MIMKIFYVLRNSGDVVFVKTAKFFVSQGGLKQPWGKHWKKINAKSIEQAREIGQRVLPTKC